MRTPEEMVRDEAEAGEPIYVTPLEYKLRLRLKRARFLVMPLQGNPQGKLQAKLSRASLYLVRRLQRQYPALGVSKPTWSVDANPTNVGMAKYAYLYFNYLDMGPFGGQPGLLMLPEEKVTVSPIQHLNRAQRRRAGV